MKRRKKFSFCEFFAGGGMVRAGLGTNWQCLFANDFDHMKSDVYRINWQDNALITADIRSLATDNLPEQADLAWASFPCQDLSLAGAGAGLKGERSGTFWPFWDLTKALIREDRAPKTIVLENVCGALSSNGGKDFASICRALQNGGYRFGAVVIDAALFVPQSRPRLFIIAVREEVAVPSHLFVNEPNPSWHTNTLQKTYCKLPAKTKANWIWWSLPEPVARDVVLADLIEAKPDSVKWHTPSETKKLLAMMSEANLAKVEEAKLTRRKMVGAIYKRTRPHETGRGIQRAEVRFDDVAGCLRTPAGGSSRQLLLLVEGQEVRSRLISSRETARLMGLPDSYLLPKKYNQAYHLTGDGVVVPVVRYLAEHLLEPVLVYRGKNASAAA